MSALFSRWQALLSDKPKCRIRDAAAQLGVKEVELVQCMPTGSTRLGDDPRPLLRGFEGVGKVMVLTRNDHSVHERRGRFESVKVDGPMGLVVGPDIDLRLFLRGWASAFAVEVAGRAGPLASVQFFDAHGDAVFKVYLDAEEGDRAAWDALIAANTVDDSPLVLTPRPPSDAEAEPGENFDKEAFLDGWGKLKDTHAFYGLLRRHGISRRAGLRAAEGHFVTRLHDQAPTQLLEAAAQDGVSIMVFVGNAGGIQIHSGPVQRIKALGDWINVLDPEFNLHLRTDVGGEVYRVVKPTVDGDVTSVELLDTEGNLVVSFFGARKPGIPENAHWRALAQGLDGWTPTEVDTAAR